MKLFKWLHWVEWWVGITSNYLNVILGINELGSQELPHQRNVCFGDIFITSFTASWCCWSLWWCWCCCCTTVRWFNLDRRYLSDWFPLVLVVIFVSFNLILISFNLILISFSCDFKSLKNVPVPPVSLRHFVVPFPFHPHSKWSHSLDSIDQWLEEQPSQLFVVRIVTNLVKLIWLNWVRLN